MCDDGALWVGATSASRDAPSTGSRAGGVSIALARSTRTAHRLTLEGEQSAHRGSANPNQRDHRQVLVRLRASRLRRDLAVARVEVTRAEAGRQRGFPRDGSGSVDPTMRPASRTRLGGSRDPTRSRGVCGAAGHRSAASAAPSRRPPTPTAAASRRTCARCSRGRPASSGRPPAGSARRTRASICAHHPTSRTSSPSRRSRAR